MSTIARVLLALKEDGYVQEEITVVNRYQKQVIQAYLEKIGFPKTVPEIPGFTHASFVLAMAPAFNRTRRFQKLNSAKAANEWIASIEEVPQKNVDEAKKAMAEAMRGLFKIAKPLGRKPLLTTEEKSTICSLIGTHMVNKNTQRSAMMLVTDQFRTKDGNRISFRTVRRVWEERT